MGNNAFLNLVSLQTKANLSQYGLTSRVQTLDKVVIALGRMGLNPDDLAYFEDMYREVEEDCLDEIFSDKIIDKNGRIKLDPGLWCSTHHIDEQIKQYVREDRFAPHQERYSF